jgi:SNF2 family DNA or RNA helicase
MPVAERDGERILLATEFREKELVKAVPGVRWSTDENTWWLPLSWAACRQLRGVFGDTLQVGAELALWARTDRDARRVPCLALRVADDCEQYASFLTALRPFQRAGVAFLATAGRALIADEMGLGKTAQVIGALEVLGSEAAYPALVVSPNSMKFTWKDEFARWAPSRNVVVIHGGAAARRKQIQELMDGIADVGIINYEGLRAHTRLAPYGSVTLSEEEKVPKELNEIPFRSVIADEAHRAKDPRAKQTRALWQVGAPATQRYAMTGTPVANSPEDVWSLMRFIAPEEFPAKTRFVERYALQSWNVFGFMEIAGLKPETQGELFDIIDPRFIRRLKAAVLPQLPAKTYTVRAVEMEPKQRKAYEEMRKEMLAALDGGTLLAVNPLVQMIRLQQFASATGEMVGEELRLTDPSNKVAALAEIVEELGDQQLVVFAESRQLIELAAKRMAKDKIKHGQITGAVSAVDRAEYVREFQAGNLKVLLITLGAGGEGLTLTAASTAVFMQRSWSLVKNAQAEDRIHRIGQEAEAVNIIDIISSDAPIEMHLRAALETKAEFAEQVTRDAATLKTWLAKG